MSNYFDDMYYESLEDDLYEEGANLDIRAKMRASNKIIRQSLASIKKELKSNNFSNAKNMIKKAESEIDSTMEYIKKCDSSVGSFVFSLFTSAFPLWRKTIVASLIGCGIVAGGVTGAGIYGAKAYPKAVENDDPIGAARVGRNTASIASASIITGRTISIGVSIYQILTTIIGVVNGCKEKNGPISLDNFNFYKATSLQVLRDYKKVLNRYSSLIDSYESDTKEMEKQAANLESNIGKELESNIAKESVVDLIFEAYKENMIDTDEVKMLLETSDLDVIIDYLDE